VPIGAHRNITSGGSTEFNFLTVTWAFRDISEMAQAANTQRLLLNELDRRVKNTLANVQAVAQQTLRSTRDPSHFANRFGGRVQARCDLSAEHLAEGACGANNVDSFRRAAGDVDRVLHGAKRAARQSANHRDKP
jgi:two-component sensor histidine kinase